VPLGTAGRIDYRIRHLASCYEPAVKVIWKVHSI